MRLTTEGIKEMLFRSSVVDKKENSTEMSDRYYRILRFYQNRLKQERENYIQNIFTPEPNNYNKIIIGHNTTTWTKADKKQSREIFKRMESRRRW